MIIGLQITGVVFALIMVYLAFIHYKKRDINSFEFMMWIIVWTGAIFIVLFPNIFQMFSGFFLVSRAFDLAVLGGFILIIPLVYKAYVKTKRIEKKLDDFIRNESLGNLKKKK